MRPGICVREHGLDGLVLGASDGVRRAATRESLDAPLSDELWFGV
jgi:hypothetical protein